MDRTIKPLNDFIFLKYDKEKDQKKEGIILADVSRDMISTAIVYAVGDEVKKVKKGDEVIFNPFIVREVKVGTDKFLIIKEKELFAINYKNVK